MNGLAAFVMRGPVQAASVAAAGLLLGYVVPPFAWLSAAVVALVALRLGDGPLLRMGLPALAVIALAGGLVWGRPGVALLGALATWAPPVLVARMLRRRSRLDDALLLACAIGWVVVGGIHAAVPDPAVMWHELLTTALQPERMAAEMQVAPESLTGLIDRMAPLMTGMVAASVAFSAVTSVLLARWWQSRLDGPGAFGREFRALRLGRVAAGITAALALAAAATPPALLDGLALVAVSVYVFQGLAVMHGVVARRGMGKGWLAAVYVLAILLPLQVMIGLTLVGAVDAWADFRGRAGSGPS